MIESAYLDSSLEGFVSSKRRLHLPPNSTASPKSMDIALACPMCRYPFGSGGKRVCTLPPCFPDFKSWITASRTKLDRLDVSSGVAPESDSNGFICLYYLL